MLCQVEILIDSEWKADEHSRSLDSFAQHVSINFIADNEMIGLCKYIIVILAYHLTD